MKETQLSRFANTSLKYEREADLYHLPMQHLEDPAPSDNLFSLCWNYLQEILVIQ